jgi:hypothetical protein
MAEYRVYGDECACNSKHAATSSQDIGCMVTRIQMRLGMCHKSECRFKSEIGINRLQEDKMRSGYRVNGDSEV